MKYRQYISYSLLVISGIFLLCTVFATDTGLANGVVTGKVLWFHLSMLFLTTCSLLAAVLTRPGKLFAFSYPKPLSGSISMTGIYFKRIHVIAIYTFSVQKNGNPYNGKTLVGAYLIECNDLNTSVADSLLLRNKNRSIKILQKNTLF